MKKHLLRLLCLALCLLLTAGAALAANDTVLGVTTIRISGNDFAADTLNGVDALYNLTGPVYDCTELVRRYYRTLYGVDVVFSDAGPRVKDNPDFWFEQTDAPSTGDVLYATPAARGKNSAHAALVKYLNADGTRAVLIEQNWRWGDTAGVNRVIPWPSATYTAYTLRCASGTPAPALSGEDTVSGWAREYVDEAAADGLLNGFVDGFGKPITRGQFALLAVRAAHWLLGDSEKITNVSGEACALGLMGGDGALNFRAYEPISREAAAVTYTRLLALAGSAPEADGSVLSRYGDRDAISSWAADGVAVMTETGLMGGTGVNFEPAGGLTVEQAVALLMRICENPCPANVESPVRTAAAAPAAEDNSAVFSEIEQAAEQSAALRAGQFVATGSAVNRMIGLAHTNG